MKKTTLSLLAIALSSTTVLAQDVAPTNMIDPAAPFGDIDITNAGLTTDEVETFLRGLTGTEVVDLLIACATVHPVVRADATTGDPAIAVPNAGGAATPNGGGATPPNAGGAATPNAGGAAAPNAGGAATPNAGGAAAPNAGAAAATATFADTDIAFCAQAQDVVMGVNREVNSDPAMPTPGAAPAGVMTPAPAITPRP